MLTWLIDLDFEEDDELLRCLAGLGIGWIVEHCLLALLLPLILLLAL